MHRRNGNKANPFRKASEANSAETHRETMNALLDSLQTENESLLDVTLTITAYNYLDDDNYKKAVRRSIMTGNFKPSNLYGLQIEGFKSSAISPVSTLKTMNAVSIVRRLRRCSRSFARSLWTTAVLCSERTKQTAFLLSSICGNAGIYIRTVTV